MKELLIYQAENGAIQLKADVDQDTLWATQKQIADLFNVNTPAINKHIKNILDSGELERSSISKMEIVRQEGKRDVERNIDHYNLDAIISIAYRVNSKKATNFRVWATEVIKQFITQGYAINQMA